MWSAVCAAQAPDKEAAAILELGGAVSHSLTEGGTSLGPNIAVEFMAVQHWLELEVGITPLFRTHRTAEWSSDVLFKRPWELSKHVEFMAGIGPEWIHTRQAGTGRNALAAEAVVDFMFWPGPNKRFGFFVEPGYEYRLGLAHENSVGFTAGLLIAIR